MDCYAKKGEEIYLTGLDLMIAAAIKRKKLEAEKRTGQELRVRYQEVGDWQQEEKPRK